jgi:D-inositol-3-phosphate glycosyltransferase
LYIDLDVFRPDERAPQIAQDVLFVGRMVANKGLDRILDALAELARRGTRLTALFVGKGPRKRTTERRAARLGLARSVRFVEWVDTASDLASIYRATRVVVCASTCEGGPRFTVEAMACGTPVVSTPVGMMTELLSDGACGALCGFDAISLAGAIERVLADERERRAMGARARQRASRFEYASILRGYAQGLHRLAGEECVRA